MKEHTSVMLDEVLAAAASLDKLDVFVDATLGLAGHSSRLLEEFPSARLYGFDQDAEAREIAAGRLAPFAGKARKKEVDARLRFLKAFWLSSDTLSGRHTAEKEAVQVALDNLTGNSGLGNLDTRWFKKKVW